jgi:hypothetical protein
MHAIRAMERLMKLCMATYAGLAFACGPQSKPPVDTPQTLPPAEPPADVSREPTKASDAGNALEEKRPPAEQ